MQYEAAIFDLDGTLINSIDDLADSCNEMLIAYDLPVQDRKSTRLNSSHP